MSILISEDLRHADYAETLRQLYWDGRLSGTKRYQRAGGTWEVDDQASPTFVAVIDNPYYNFSDPREVAFHCVIGPFPREDTDLLPSDAMRQEFIRNGSWYALLGQPETLAQIFGPPPLPKDPGSERERSDAVSCAEEDAGSLPSDQSARMRDLTLALGIALVTLAIALFRWLT